MSDQRQPSPLPAGAPVGRFTLRGVLGRGRNATIYRAFDPTHQRDVALKLFNPPPDPAPTLPECFEAEARALQALSHPSLVRVIGCGNHDGRLFIVMELLRGMTLRDLITAHPAGLEREAALGLFRQIADGIAYLHAHHLVHGNLKPDNIILRSEQEAVIAGFRLPCLDLKQRAASETPEISTLAYQAPEQITHYTASARTDVYTLGILLYELTTGDVPFRGGSRQELSYQQLYATPPPPGQHRIGIDPRIDVTVLRALSKNPLDRQGSAVEMLEDLDQRRAAEQYETAVFDRDDAREVRRHQTGPLRGAPASIPAPMPAEHVLAPAPTSRLPWLIALLTMLAVFAVAAVLLLL